MTATLAGKIDWDAMEDAQPVMLPETEEQKPDTIPPTSVPYGHCKVCGEEIENRRPRQRYHEDCKPSRKITTGTTRITSGRGLAKKEAEAAEAVAALRSKIVQTLVLMSAFDRYDTFVVMVSLPNAMEALKGLLVRYDKLRAEMLAAKTGGSIFAFALSILCMALPILAHHGMIPQKQVTRLLFNLPFTLHQLNQRLADGEATLTNIMEEQLRAQADRNKSAEERVRQTETVVDANGDS